MFGFIKKAVKSVGKAAAAVAKNPMVKMVAGGAALVFPPIGVPATLALATTDKVLGALQKGSPEQKQAAARMVTRTAVAAKAGDQEAKRGLALMLKRKRQLAAGAKPVTAQAVKKAAKRRFQNAYVVTPNGRIAYRGDVTEG